MKDYELIALMAILDTNQRYFDKETPVKSTMEILSAIKARMKENK